MRAQVRRIGVGALTSMTLACAHVQTDTRVEKGPVLRTFDREQVHANAGVQAQVQPHWPELGLTFSTFDLCKREKVEESVEDRITEISSPTAGPAIVTGISLTAIGAGLFLGRGLFPNKPDPHVIDASGHYNLSQKQIATGWSIGLMIAGVPSLGEGLVQSAQTGERSESRKVESVVSSVEVPCHPSPVAGLLEFPAGKSPPPPLPVPPGGRVGLTESFVRHVELGGFTLDGRAVVVDDEDMGRLDSFRACLEMTPVTADGLAGLGVEALQHRLDRARACQSLPNAPGADTTAALERELRKRKPSPPPTAKRVLQSFDDALAAYPPSQSFGADSTELAKLADAEALAGQSLLLRGIVGPRLDAETIQFDVGTQRLWVLLERDAPWLSEAEEGSRIELLGVVLGRETRGSVPAPLVRGIWARPAP